MSEQVTNITLNSKYRIVFEQAAVKGVLGFKVEVNGDDKAIAKAEAIDLLDYAKAHAPSPPVEAK